MGLLGKCTYCNHSHAAHTGGRCEGSEQGYNPQRRCEFNCLQFEEPKLTLADVERIVTDDVIKAMRYRGENYVAAREVLVEALSGEEVDMLPNGRVTR